MHSLTERLLRHLTCNGEMTTRQLAVDLRVSPARVSHALYRAEADGLVARTRRPWVTLRGQDRQTIFWRSTGDHRG